MGAFLTSRLSSSFSPTCHFSNSLSQLRTVLRGQTTRAVLKSSFSQSSRVWRNVTTYRPRWEQLKTATSHSFGDKKKKKSTQQCYSVLRICNMQQCCKKNATLESTWRSFCAATESSVTLTTKSLAISCSEDRI